MLVQQDKLSLQFSVTEFDVLAQEDACQDVQGVSIGSHDGQMPMFRV
jgi:hypothetical protein